MDISMDALKEKFIEQLSPHWWTIQEETAMTVRACTSKGNRFRVFRGEPVLTKQFRENTNEYGTIYRTQSIFKDQITREDFFLFVYQPLQDEVLVFTLCSQAYDELIFNISERYERHDLHCHMREIEEVPEIEDVFLKLVSELPEYRLHVVTGSVGIRWQIT